MRPAYPVVAKVVAFTALAACAGRLPAVSPPAVAPHDAAPEIGTAAPGSALGEWARLAEPLDGGVLRFALARPAYVAIFAITPGEEVRLLYPATASQNVPIAAGEHARSARRDIGGSTRVTSLRERYTPELRYLYLVASDRPLRLAEPLRWPDGGRYAGASLGGVPLDARTLDVDRVMEALFDLVAPDLDSAQVDTDVLAYYPDVRFRQRGRTLAMNAFRCYDGRLVYVPSSFRDDYFPRDWYGIDFSSGRYVGSDCYAGYYVGEQRGTRPARPGVTQPAAPTPPRLAASEVRAHDVRPSIPLTPDELRPVAPAGPGGSGTDQLEFAPSPRPPRLEPRERSPEPRPVPVPAPQAVEPRAAEPAGAEPRPVELRPEPPHPEPQREEPARPEPVRSEPVRSEPVRSEPPREEPREAPRETPRETPREIPGADRPVEREGSRPSESPPR